MRTTIFHVIAVALAFTVFFGCSRERQDVLVSVGSVELTRAELNARAENIAALLVHKSAKTDAAKIKAEFCKGYAQYWVEDTVLANAAKADGVVPSTNELARCRKGAFLNFRAKGDKSYEDLMKLPGFNRELWEAQVRSEALRLAMKDHWARKFPANLPPSYADDVIRKINEENAAFAISNRLQWAKATNVWEKLKQGADFGQTARAHSELTDEAADDGDWAVVDAKFLSDEPKLLKWLKQAKPGEFSPPIAADNGVMIARLDGLEEDDGFAVSRIFFHLASILPPAGKEAIVAAAERKYVDDLFARKLAELVKAAKPVYSENKTHENTNRKETK